MTTNAAEFQNLSSTILKKSRKEVGLDIHTVARILSENNIQDVTSSALYAWESAQSSPNPYTFLNLCDMYNITDVLGTFQIRKNPSLFNLNMISMHETEMLMSYRSHPEMHPAIKKILGI